MFTIFHSNRSDLFKKLLINVISNNLPSNPIQSEIILTNHSKTGIIEQWIQIELANYFGIAANITFMSVASFIQKTFSKILSDSSIIQNFNCIAMYWKFMKIFSTIHTENNFSIIQQYLRNDNDQRKCGQLSEQIAKLFNQYLIYRPDWLNSWQSNKIIDDLESDHQIWQLELWKTLLKNKNHKYQEIYINPLQYYVNFLQNIEKINCDLPNRIFIFGVISMAPIYWEILQLLSRHIDIYLWFINPCKNWDNTINQSVSSAIQKNNQLHDDQLYLPLSTIANYHYVKLNHPLLKVWGKIGQDTLYLLTQSKDVFEIKDFVVPKEDSLLHILQKDILECPNSIIDTNAQINIVTSETRQKYVLKSKDQSITFHVCYSIRREIEVLHDNLLSMFVNDPLLSPGDIIVMAPDIYFYTSAIHAVFNNTQDRYIPFVISSNHEKYIHPIISTFLNILKIPYSRFTSEEILSFLTVSSVATRFNINEEGIKLLHQWTIESGIRWGLDNITIGELNLPITNQNTWYFGLTRILLGYSMKSQDETWEGILPYDDTIITEEYIQVIIQLGEFLKTLRKWRDRLKHGYTLIKWVPYIKEIIDDFFYCSNLDIEENKALFLIRTCCKEILESGIQSEYNQIINIIVLRDKLYNKLNQEKINYKFLPHVINFCDIKPVCCIPFKVVCIIGMNDNMFPKNTLSCDFNLIKKTPRNGDNNIREEDYYSFLLVFLSAQERIYISFIESRIDDNTVNYPSTLIDELLEYIAQKFSLIGDEIVDTGVNIIRIRQHLFQWYSQTPFASENFIPGNKQQSFASEWLSVVKNDNNFHTDFFIASNYVSSFPQCIKNTISFHDLYNFYRHPIRVWFQKRLGVYFKYEQNILNLFNDEPFGLNRLDQFQLNTKLIDCLIHNENTDKLYRNFCSSGILPYGAFGKLYWMKQYKKMITLANQIKIYHFSETYKLDISLVFNSIKLTGQLNIVQKNGLIRWKPTHLSMKDGLLLWLEHLAYCAMGGEGESRLFGINNIWHFPNLSQLKAKKLLFFFVSGYYTGINTPLLLLPQSGGTWVHYIFDRNTKTISLEKSRKKKARQQLIKTWQGNIKNYSFPQGECCDPYLRILIPFYLNEEDINKISKIAELYFFSAMKYRM